MAQANLGRLSAFANVEVGSDLANQSVFSTEAYRTSVVGAAVRLMRGWNLQAEMFRNQLNFTMNPENIFLLENGAALAGVSPAAATLPPPANGAFTSASQSKSAGAAVCPRKAPTSSPPVPRSWSEASKVW